MYRRLPASVAVLCAALVASACGSPAQSANADNPAGQSPTPITLRIPTSPPTPTQLAIFVATEKGFFATEGFEATRVGVSSSAAMAPALTAGQVEVVPTSVSVMVGLRQKGIDVKMITGYLTGYSYTLVARKGLDLPAGGTFEQKMAALNGKTIGITGGADGVLTSALRAMISAGGGDPASISFSSVDFGSTQIAALQTSQVDLVLADYGTASTADRLGVGDRYFSMLNDPPAQFKGLVTSGTTVMATTLQQHPDFAERYNRALRNTFAYMKDPANAVDVRRVATGVMGLADNADLDGAIAAIESTFGAQSDRPTLERSLEFLYSTKQVAPDPKVTVDQLVDPAVITS